MDAKPQEKMNVNEYLKSLFVSSKGDDIPGTVEAYLDELCPTPGCGKRLKIFKPCCSNPYYKKECLCGYRIDIVDYSK